MTNSLIAVDLDGTLITCQNRQLEVLRYVRPDLNSGRLDHVWQLKRQGQNTASALRSIGLSGHHADEAARRWRTHIEDPYWLSLDSVFASVGDALRQSANAGWKMVVITARRNYHSLVQQFAQLGIGRWVEDLIVADPADSIQSKAVALSKLQPYRMIGDTESDGEASRKSGTAFIAVETGQRSAAFLASRGFPDCRRSFADAVESLVPGNRNGSHRAGRDNEA